MTLAEFLLARIAEDETIARAANDEERWEYEAPESAHEAPSIPAAGLIACGSCEHSGVDEHKGPHIARWDPARVLAECEAKRRIVDLADSAQREVGMGDWPVKQFFDGRWSLAEAMLRALALPYADHPDYREEWKP